jgi:hypothetical protein
MFVPKSEVLDLSRDCGAIWAAHLAHANPQSWRIFEKPANLL